MNEQKYPRGKAEFSSFEESEHEQRTRWAAMKPIDRFFHCLELMANNSGSKLTLDETGNEFLLPRLKP